MSNTVANVGFVMALALLVSFLFGSYICWCSGFKRWQWCLPCMAEHATVALRQRWRRRKGVR